MHEGVRTQPDLAGTGGPQNAVRVRPWLDRHYSFSGATVVEDAIKRCAPSSYDQNDHLISKY